MKIIKLMLTGIVVLSFVLAQDGTQGGQPTGPPPCDPNATYPVADPGPDGGCGNYSDCNGNGAYDLGEPCGDGGQQGQPPFGDVDANGDGGIDREEARAFFGQDEEGNDDPEFDSGFDNYAGEDGVVDEAEYATAAADQGVDEEYSNDPNDDEGQNDAVVYDDEDQNDAVVYDDEDQNDAVVYDDDPHSGPMAPATHWEGNQHALCGGMDEYMLDTDQDGVHEGPYAVWNEDGDGNPVECNDNMGGDMDYQDGNPDHLQGGSGDQEGHEAGATCRFAGLDGQGEECGYVHTGDSDEDHHHCDYCGVAANSGEEMHEHMMSEHPDNMENQDGDGDHEGPPLFGDVDANGDGVIDRDEARAFFGKDEEGNDDPNFDAEYDDIAGEDGVVDPAEYAAAEDEDDDGDGGNN